MHRAAKRVKPLQVKPNKEPLSQAEIDRMAEAQKDRAEAELNRKMPIADVEARRNLHDYCLFMQSNGPYESNVDEAILMTLKWLGSHPLADKHDVWDKQYALELVVTDGDAKYYKEWADWADEESEHEPNEKQDALESVVAG